MIRTIDMATFIRSFNVMNSGDVDFFLGSGASASSGIPTGGNMVWEFKRDIYCTETETSIQKFKDIQSLAVQAELQDYFDAQGNHPTVHSPDEYAHYFELCFPTAIARERYIQSKVSDIAPTLGHFCLADLFVSKKVNNIWTTNFDELVESGVKTLVPNHSFNVYSSSNKKTAPSNTLSSILKLHGDYRYDRIKNTSMELQSLEATMRQSFYENLRNKGLIVIGYSGCDESIMRVLEERISEPGFLSFGLTWMIPQNTQLSNRVANLLEKACSINESSCVVEIHGFDEVMYSIYKAQGKSNGLIDDRWKDYPKRKLPLVFHQAPVTEFIKLNTFVSESYPNCNVFDTDITSWAELKKVLADSDIVAGLYSGKIYCFEEPCIITVAFAGHIKSEIKLEAVPYMMLYHDDSVYIGLLYKLIEKYFVNTLNLSTFGRNKYYDVNTVAAKKLGNSTYRVADAIEVSISAHSGKLYLSVLPTVRIESTNGRPIADLEKQLLVNQAMSSIYNKQYDEKLKYWNKAFLTPGSTSICMEHKGFALRFTKVFMSSGGNNRNPVWPSVVTTQYPEPEILLDVLDTTRRTVNQLKGITRFAPLDYSYSKVKKTRSAIRLAVISPQEHLPKIIAHLNSLRRNSSPQKSDDGFLTAYNGFETVYKRGLDVPTAEEISRIISFQESITKTMSNENFVDMLKGFVDNLSTRHSFDVAVVYIPKSFERFRMAPTADDDFNLHDALKLYATDKGVKLQFIEERSIGYYDPCKVLWALSTSIYAKAGGVLWQPVSLSNDTAFVGVSYAQSVNKGICIGCSQLFDSTGTGIRLLLRKINEPDFRGKNPYMKCDEAREMMSALREQYYNCDPTNRLKRIVIHKTTHFTAEEVKGFTQALEGIEDIELLQIQEYSSWRGIRYDADISKGATAFAIKRGTTIPLSDDTFLLWTHGCIQHDELKGKLNYYKGGRGIPAPLMVKRFYGKASGDTLAKEILMLSKMNWNSGDTLYKQLPVTLDFAKTLSRMSKQNEAIYNKAYDFRYFM